MYTTRGYPIDFDLQRANRAQRRSRLAPTLRALADSLRSAGNTPSPSAAEPDAGLTQYPAAIHEVRERREWSRDEPRT
jgi:hypothetical protein